MTKQRAKKETVVQRRAKWAAQAQRERDRVKRDPAYRLTWLRRPCIKASMKPATWRAKVAEAKAAVARQATRRGRAKAKAERAA